MEEVYSIHLIKLIEEFGLEQIDVPANLNEIKITTSDVSRPGLALTGFYEYFEASRVQLIGKAEHRYLVEQTPDARRACLERFVAAKPSVIIITTNLDAPAELVEATHNGGVPLLRTHLRTSEFSAALVASLNVSLAPRITRHGVLVEVYGEGILILGDSGVG